MPNVIEWLRTELEAVKRRIEGWEAARLQALEERVAALEKTLEAPAPSAAAVAPEQKV